MEQDISILIREANKILGEEDSTMTKVGNALGQGASNIYTGLRDTGKALFSPAKNTGPSVFGSSASDAFKAVKNVFSGPAAVKGALDTTLQKAATSAAGGSASTPMHNSVEGMINRIVEGTFHPRELDR